MTAKEFSYSVSETTENLKPHAIKFTKDIEDANDLVQETSLKALRNYDKFKAGTNLKAWIYTIMKNLFISNYHKKKRRNTFIDSTDNLHYLNDSDDHTVENDGETKFALSDINKEIKSLNDTYRTPFLMHFRGYKYHEIADKLQLPIGTVKNRIHVARRELKKELSDYQNTY